MNVRILSRVVVYDNNLDKILLVRNKNCDFWYLPGGGWEYEKENILDCGVREVKEETGLEITIDKFMYIREYHDSPVKIFFETFWLAHVNNSVDLNQNHIDMDPNGSVEEVRWFSREELQGITVFPDILKERFWLEVGNIYKDSDRFIGF